MTLNRYDEAESRLQMRYQQFEIAFRADDEGTLKVATALEELYERRDSGAENQPD